MTRGVKAETVIGNRFWWEGPLWLKNSSLPLDRSWESELQVQEGEECVLANWEGSVVIRLVKWDRFSNFRRLIRAVAWMLRFMYNARITTKKTDELSLNDATVRKTGELSLEEEQVAKETIIKLMQREYFHEEISSLKKGVRKPKLALVNQLNLYLDGEILRCRGRLEYAQLHDET